MAGRLLASFPEQNASFGGVWPSLHDLQVPFVRDARNVVFTSLGIRKMQGWVEPTDNAATSSPIRGMIQTTISGSATLFYADPNNIYKYEDGSVTASLAGSRYAGFLHEDSQGPASVWSLENFGNWVLAANGIDPVQLNKGEGFLPLEVSGQFETAEILIKKGPYILAMNVETSADGSLVNQFNWCHTDDVEQWSPNINNAAASLTIRDMKGPIQAAVPLGDYIAVYGPAELVLVSYLGAPFYFGYKKALDGIGAVSKACVISVGRRNYGLSRQGFWVTDGTDFQWIDEPAIRNWFQNRMDWSQKSKVCGYHNKRNQQVIWFYPNLDSEDLEPNEGVGFDYTKNLWTVYDFGRTSVYEQGVFGYPTAGDQDGHFFFHDVGKDANGKPLGCWIESARMSFGAPENFKEILELRTAVHELTGTLRVAISGVADLDESASYTNSTIVDQSFTKVNVRKMGRYISVRYESTSTGADFIITSVRFHGEVKGVD